MGLKTSARQKESTGDIGGERVSLRKPNSKCKTCWGYGLWAIGDPCPMGPLDFSDGAPVKVCPECGAGGKPEPIWTTLKGKKIPVSKIKDDHLLNIITHLEDQKQHYKLEYQRNLLGVKKWQKIINREVRRRKL